MAHREKERALGQEIWPCRPKIPETDKHLQSRKDSAFCESLSCSEAPKDLEW